MNFAVIESVIGNLKIIEENQKIIEIKFVSEKIIEPKTNFLKLVKLELEEYFRGERKKFSFEIEIRGTEFQRRVYKELMNIPYGKTKSYKEIAKLVGNEKAVRAVGGANNKNKIPIIIPCHRVIGSNGNLVGYAGGIDIKQKLLNLEKEFVNL